MRMWKVTAFQGLNFHNHLLKEAVNTVQEWE